MREILLIIAAATLVVVTACGAGSLGGGGIDVPPGASSAGSDSGFGVATGGDHYTTVHSIGSSLPKPFQTGDNGRYMSK